MQVVLALINVIYFLSLIITFQFYPAGPIYDLETDEIIGQKFGLTKTHILMLLPFSMISYWGYNEINKKNELGVMPGYCLDIFGTNLFTQFIYSFSNKGLYIYWIIPAYAAWKIGNLLKGFCCSGKPAPEMETPEETKSNRQMKREKAEKEGGAKQRVKYMK